MTPAEREAYVAVARRHSEVETAGDLEATMGTLDDDPCYEFWPLGVELRGRDAVRRYYEHLIAEFLPRVASYEVRSQWVTDVGVGQEYKLYLDGPDGPARHDIIGILAFGTPGRLSGERIWGSDELLKTMVGPALDETTPLR